MHQGQRLAGLTAILLLGLLGCGTTDGGNAGTQDGLNGANDGANDGANESVAGTSALISLSSLAVNTRGPLPAIPAHLSAESGEPEAQRYVLVKFPGPITAEQARSLQGAATRVYTYLPYSTYLVKMPAPLSKHSHSASQLASTGAVWSGLYHPLYKISRAVAAVQTDDAISSGHGHTDPRKSVMLQVYPDANLGRVIDAIRALGVKDIAGWRESAFFSRIRLVLTPEEIAHYRELFARIPEVFWVDIEPRKTLLNDTTVWVGQSGLKGNMATPLFTKGLQGQGQIVGVLDTGIDPDMCYFRDSTLGLPPQNACDGGTAVDLAQRKVIAVDFLWPSECADGILSSEWDTHDHGTHVAGTVAGDNLATLLLHDAGDGMAPGAKLVIQDGGFKPDPCGDLPGIGCPVVDLKPIFQQAYDQGARIHTNSWGDQEDSPVQDNYTVACQDVDEFMWTHKDFLLLFAAGNSGPGVGSISSPATAKSTVAVGATQHAGGAGAMASFSSCGPTDDGRIKPEVTIPGRDVVSASNDTSTSSKNCNTQSMSGTSMASPGAAGFAALVRQYYEGGFYPSGIENPPDGFPPSAALLRATLVNSGEIMNNLVIPANCQGWGRIHLETALYFASDARRLWVSDDDTGFATGSVNETQSFTFTVHPVATPLKVTLAWTDYPSTPAANPHINNDLDLEVTGPDGTLLGNVFNAGASTPGGTPDRINTLEQVLVKKPAPGDYTVTVRSFNVPNGPQPFALVVSGAASRSGTPGAPCAAAGDCLNGLCVDGVCCDSACDAGACDACSTAAGAKVEGTCALLTGVACDDADACTQTDTCNAGVCLGENPVVCSALDACHDAGACDPATGLCSDPPSPDGTACDDGSACTQVDACQAGLCTGASPVVCPMPEGQCEEQGACDPATGACSSPVKADGAACEDGNGCTQGDACREGVCVTGAPLVCPAPDDCHEAGTCDSTTGECSYAAKPDGAPCPDGQCMGGTCAPLPAATSGGPDPVESGGCGCGVASTSEGGVAGIGLGLLMALRRRRRSKANVLRR